MKKTTTLIILFFICWNFLISQDVKILSEIEIVHYWSPVPLKDYSTDTIYVHLDSISAFDTLILKGEIRGCGEWGGHIEMIEIFRTNKGVVGKYRNYGGISDCPDDIDILYPKWFKPKEKYDTVKLLTKPEEELVSLYIEKFWGFERSWAVSNAPQEFWLIFGTKEYKRLDLSGRWSCFIDLRDKLFKKKIKY